VYRSSLCLPLLALLLGVAAAQEPKGEAKKQEGKAPPRQVAAALPELGEVDVHFLNTSTVRMTVRSERLEITTFYGKLAVPVSDIRLIEFGLHFPDGVEAKIEHAIKNLAHKDYRERDNASKILLELGPFSYPAVLDAKRSKDMETSRRAGDILKKLEAKHPKKDLKTSANDKLVTPTFTIVGRIVTPTLKAKTELFGEVELSVSKMRTLRAVGAPSREVEIGVDAGKYANAGQWLETEFEADGKTAIVITAKGVIDQWPQQPGQYLVGPGGQLGRMGGIIAGGGVGGPGGGRIILGPGMNTQMYSGALLGKIGDNGEPFIIGERYDNVPDREGKLYLQIGPSLWGCPSSGSYHVAISRKE